jgi:hypothetical protein
MPCLARASAPHLAAGRVEPRRVQVEAGCCRLALGEAGDRTVVGVLVLDRWDVTPAECRRRWLNQSTHSRVATSTSSRPRQGPWRRMSSVLYRPIRLSAAALTLLYPSSCCGSRPGSGSQRAEEGPRLAGEVSLQAADDLGLALALEGSPSDVGLGRFVVLHAHDDRPVESGVGLAVTATVEPVPCRQTGGGRDRATPQSRAQAASERTRSMLSPATMSSSEAVSEPTPKAATSCGTSWPVSSASSAS